MDSCEKCKQSHIPEAVVLAIKEGEPGFLRFVLASFSKRLRLPLSNSELVKLIAKSSRRDEILDLIEALNRWSGAKKLRKLCNENKRKSDVKVRFWKYFVA